MLTLGALVGPSMGTAVASEDKVTICHVPPGNPENAHTITIAVSGLQAHLGDNPEGLHGGDSYGECPGSETETTETTSESSNETETTETTSESSNETETTETTSESSNETETTETTSESSNETETTGTESSVETTTTTSGTESSVETTTTSSGTESSVETSSTTSGEEHPAQGTPPGGDPGATLPNTSTEDGPGDGGAGTPISLLLILLAVGAAGVAGLSPRPSRNRR
jgi:cobalamin biosynthesis Mg chelatase CobN